MPQPLALALKPQAPTRQLLAHNLWLATPTPLPLEATQLHLESTRRLSGQTQSPKRPIRSRLALEPTLLKPTQLPLAQVLMLKQPMLSLSALDLSAQAPTQLPLVQQAQPASQFLCPRTAANAAGTDALSSALVHAQRIAMQRLWGWSQSHRGERQPSVLALKPVR